MRRSVVLALAGVGALTVVVVGGCDNGVQTLDSTTSGPSGVGSTASSASGAGAMGGEGGAGGEGGGGMGGSGAMGGMGGSGAMGGMGGGGMGGMGGGGMGGGMVDPPLGPNQFVNGDFEAFTVNMSGPFDPPDSWTPFGAIFNPNFTAVTYAAFGTQADGAVIFPSNDPFPGFMMSRAAKVFGISADAGGGNVEPSLGTLFQEYTGAAIPAAGTQLRLTGYAYHASQDPLGPGAEAYLVIKCLDAGFANICDGTESTPITMSTQADTWLPFSVDLAMLPAGTAFLQAGIEFKQCAGPGGTACSGADAAGSVYFDELVFSNNEGAPPMVDPPLGPNQFVNGDFEMFTPNMSGPFDPPNSWTDFGAIFNPNFTAVPYAAYGTQADGANIFPSNDPFPGFNMTRALKVFGISADAGGGNVEPSLGTLFQEFTGAAIPAAGTQLRLTGYAYHASQDPLGPQAEAYLVIKCLDAGFANLCAGTESTPITMSTTADTWTPFSVDLAMLPANTAFLQAGVEFKQCGGPGGTACMGTDAAGSVFFDDLVFSNNAGGSGNLAVNGDFEAGNISGWVDFSAANNGTFAATMAQQNGGQYSGNLTAAVPNMGDPASFPVIKQEQVGIGTVQPNQMIDIQFDLFGSVQGAGGVFFAEFFSEGAMGVTQADILGGGPLFPMGANDWTAGWVTYQFTVMTSSDVANGVTLQLKADCGGNVGCQLDTYIDNVSITPQ